MSRPFLRTAGLMAAPCLRTHTSYAHRTVFNIFNLRQTQQRNFSRSSVAYNWLIPRSGESMKSRKGRPRVRTGGSTKGTTLTWGDYGLRLRDHGRRISQAQLKVADETIKKRLRGEKYRLFYRVSADIGVYKSGNDQRMGKGKGSFDHWACRVAVSRIVFELKGQLHEQVVRDAFRLAGNKLPGLWEFVKRGDPPVMGITKLSDVNTVESLKRARKDLPMVPAPSDAHTAERLPATTPP